MNIAAYRNHCLQKKGVTEAFPFDEHTLVHKVMGKMFTLANVVAFDSINLKCHPDTAVRLRKQYEGVIPGYHMNKKHWNTVRLEADIPDQIIYQWIDDSYKRVLAGLPKKDQAFLEERWWDS